ncbi:hypothetical protein BDZ91DRAFT_801925 [Kalaharituber pfeilii]|nr:hypothetical protein BDZ91DRAFT_801925 [Kalaharituber pfeilii]
MSAPVRDTDLIDPDVYLTDARLDTLWQWYWAANRDNVDPQFIFGKLVNAIRKPYRVQLVNSLTGGSTFGNNPHSPSTTEVAPSANVPQHGDCSSTVMELKSKLANLETEVANKQSEIQHLQETSNALKKEKQDVEEKLISTTSELDSKLANAEREVKNKQGEIDRLRQSSNELEKDNNDLQAKLKEVQ